MAKDIKIDLRAKELGIDLKNASKKAIAQLDKALGDVTNITYNEMVRQAQTKLKTIRDDYINALHYDQIGISAYIIYLDDSMGMFEDGFPKFDMKPGLLNGPNATTTEKGTKYNTVPQTFRPASKASTMPEHLKVQLKDVIKKNKLNKVFKDKTTGKPLEGVVARVKDTGVDQLKGLVKVQKQYQKKTQSFYMTFRRVSSNSDPSKWIHPGFSGIHIFKDAEQYLEEQIDRILKVIFEEKYAE